MKRIKHVSYHDKLQEKGIDADKVFNLAYWITWITQREQKMIRKGYQRYLDDEKNGRI